MISACALLLVAASQHIGSKGDYEELHPSIGVTCEHDELGDFSAGYFRNSEKDDTVWLAKRKYTDIAKSMYGQSFYEYGLVVGYADHPVLPMARVGYSLMSTKHVGAELFMMPGLETNKGKSHMFLVVGAQLKIK